MAPKDHTKKCAKAVQPADEVVQKWWEDPIRIKAWEALKTKIDEARIPPTRIEAWEELKTKIDEAIDNMDTEYLEINDIHDLMLFRAARYAQDFLEDGVQIRAAVVTELQSQGETVQVESNDDLINGRGENTVKYAQAKALVIEMVQKTIMVKQEVRRLRQGISENAWKRIGEEARARRKQAYEKLVSMG
ncbi:hypothetical protein HII31_00982 [Pseudocercospora fuligena]|uniref:Uncharacterized protein n=1 Tax=Pseudocercospora fuligena TaxID=685502 RepID=A0A8H6RUJ2_9PEZI|nr:hypothetical protein HII31_00982 [Pseudocercospora fuligena]